MRGSCCPGSSLVGLSSSTAGNDLGPDSRGPIWSPSSRPEAIMIALLIEVV